MPHKQPFHDNPNRWEFSSGGGAVVAAAVHNGHNLRPSIAQIMTLGEADRLREEDPYTGCWTSIVDQRIVVNQSRFEYDLNRSRETCVYESPEDAWGLAIYPERLPYNEKDSSLARYDAFYAEAHTFFKTVQKDNPHFVVFDLHSYNHLRNGPDGPKADPDGNPEINIGTGTMTQSEQWRGLVDGVIDDLRTFDYGGRQLDVRENVKFVGRQFGQWLHNTFPGTACCISIECKKYLWMNGRRTELSTTCFDR